MPFEKKNRIIAIDGRAASGKTMLAENLREAFDADVIHMDDFFLPPQLRTAQRLEEAGGNIHYERFAAEVLPFIYDDRPFNYRVFDCHSMDYSGMKSTEGKQFIIVEGAYSQHPKFDRYADITIFLDISHDEQLMRIRRRNGERLLETFRDKWIPMEEKYFNAYNIRSKADIKADSAKISTEEIIDDIARRIRV